MKKLERTRDVGFHSRPGQHELPRGPGLGWGTIVADPPWPFIDKGSRATPHYDFMTEAEILALPVGAIAAPDSHLYLWTTDSHLPLALEAVRGWGFEYKHLIIWAKVAIDGKIRFGLGHWFRKAHEVCIFAVQGKAKILDRSLPSLFASPPTIHSAKPSDLQEMAERASPGPRLDLFARKQRAGWTCWGSEDLEQTTEDVER